MKELVERARFLMRIILAITLAYAWSTLVLNNSFERLMNAELVEAERVLTPDHIKAVRNQLEKVVEPPVISQTLDIDHSYLAKSESVPLELKEYARKVLGEYERTFKSAESYADWIDEKSDRILKEIKIEDVLLDPSVTNAFSELVVSYPKRATAMAYENIYIVEALNSASAALQPKLPSVIRKARSENKIDNLLDLKDYFEEKQQIELPYTGQRIDKITGEYLLLFSALITLLALLSVVSGMGSVKSFKNLDGYDWIFFQSALGFILGCFWLASIVLAMLYSELSNRHSLHFPSIAIIASFTILVFVICRKALFIRKKLLKILCDNELIYNR